MNGKIKKILTTTMLSALTVTAIGCSSNGNKLARNIDKSMAQFVTSVNKLDYVETTKPTNEKIGKIVETSAPNYLSSEYKTQNINRELNYLNNNLSEKQIENSITKPSDRTDDFKLFILSDIPFVTLASDDSKANISIKVKFSTDKIQETSTEIDEKINTLILKRSILLIYVNEIYSGNVNLSEANKTAINAYVNVIKENTSYLNGNRGMVKNQLKLASDLAEKNSNDNLVNYYIIKSGEALETRASKFDSTISAIDSITDIIESCLTPSSSYYNAKLSGTYDNIFSNLSSKTSTEITNSSTNREVADTLTNTLTSLFPVEKNETKNDKNSENGIMTLPMIDENVTEKPNYQSNNVTSNASNASNSNSTRINSNLNYNSSNTNRNSTRQNNTVQSNTNNQSKIQNTQNSTNLNRNFSNNQSNLQNLEINNNGSNTNVARSNIGPVRQNTETTNSTRNINRRSNMNNLQNTNPNTIRAERTPERVRNEENVTSSLTDENRAIRVPYRPSNR